MNDFNDLIAHVDATCFDAFGETAVYDNRCVLTVVIDKAVPYTDEEGSVISNIDEVHIMAQQGLTIENGKTIEVDDRSYKVQRFLRQSGNMKTYEIV